MLSKAGPLIIFRLPRKELTPISMEEKKEEEEHVDMSERDEGKGFPWRCICMHKAGGKKVSLRMASGVGENVGLGDGSDYKCGLTGGKAACYHPQGGREKGRNHWGAGKEIKETTFGISKMTNERKRRNNWEKGDGRHSLACFNGKEEVVELSLIGKEGGKTIPDSRKKKPINRTLCNATQHRVCPFTRTETEEKEKEISTPTTDGRRKLGETCYGSSVKKTYKRVLHHRPWHSGEEGKRRSPIAMAENCGHLTSRFFYSPPRDLGRTHCNIFRGERGGGGGKSYVPDSSNVGS